MAIRRSFNVEHYRAEQAKPVFIVPPRRYVVAVDWGKVTDIVLWTAALGMVAALGFILASILLVM